MRRRFFKIHQILLLFAPYWAPIGASPLIFAHLNPHSTKMLPMVQISSVVLEKKLFEGKVYRRRPYAGWWLIPIAHLSILLR